MSDLVLVTDRRLCLRPLVDVVREVTQVGVARVWFRDRDLEPVARRRLAEEIARAIAGRAALVVGADIDLAADLGAAGVHLPEARQVVRARERLGADALIGVSAHSLADAIAARDAGADYVTLSPIFPTQSKPGYGPALGPRIFRATRHIGCGALALGGVTPGNLAECLNAGATGIAVMGGILAAVEPARAAGDYMHALRTTMNPERRKRTDHLSVKEPSEPAD